MLAGANSGGPASPHRIHRQWRSALRTRNFEADRIINTFLVSTRCSVLEKRESPVNKGRILALDKTRDKWTLPGTTLPPLATLRRPRRFPDRSFPEKAALRALTMQAKRFRAFILRMQH